MMLWGCPVTVLWVSLILSRQTWLLHSQLAQVSSCLARQRPLQTALLHLPHSLLPLPWVLGQPPLRISTLGKQKHAAYLPFFVLGGKQSVSLLWLTDGTADSIVHIKCYCIEDIHPCPYLCLSVSLKHTHTLNYSIVLRHRSGHSTD